jgi:hypothetical protein
VTILNWNRAGAPYGDNDTNAVQNDTVDVFPKEIVLDLRGRQQLLVTAGLSDGTKKDITDQVVFKSSNPEVAKVSESGMVEPVGMGETSVLIRAVGHSLSARVGVISSAISEYPALPRSNFIDDFVFAKLKKFHVRPS